MAYDELELDRIGDRKTAVFFIISDTTQTYNFLVALAFSQMFNLLCERADNVHGGRLPHHVRVLWDEAANTGQVPQLEKLVAVIRSREVSLCLLYQQLAQCKAIYDKHAETILGNMDSVVFIVEDVLVLFRECIVRHSHLIHRTRLVQTGPPAAVNEPVEVKSVFLFIGLRRITVVRMPFQIILGREERGQAPKLQNTFISRHGCKFGWGHQFPAQPLGILTVAFRLTTGAAVGLHTDCGFSQPVLGYFLDGAGFAATKEHIDDPDAFA